MFTVLDTRAAPLRVELFFSYLPTVIEARLVYLCSNRPEIWDGDPLVASSFILSESLFGSHDVVRLGDTVKGTFDSWAQKGRELPKLHPWMASADTDKRMRTFRRIVSSEGRHIFGHKKMVPFSIPQDEPLIVIHFGGTSKFLGPFRKLTNEIKHRLGLRTVQTGQYEAMEPDLGCSFDLRNCTTVDQWCSFLHHSVALVTDSETAATAAVCTGTPVLMSQPPKELESDLVWRLNDRDDIVGLIGKVRKWRQMG